MFAGPQLVSIGRPSTVLAPIGAIVGYEGTVASIPSPWALCDGTGGTPNLLDKMILGADDVTYIYNATGGSSSGQVTGTSASGGGHGNIGGLSSNAAGSQERGVGGVHDHALTGDLSTPVPPSRRLAYIMATAEAPFPEDAVVWVYGSVIDGFSEFSDLEDRFIYGTTNNTRTTLGADTRDIALTVASSGGHVHPNTGSNIPGGGGSSVHPNATGGAHIHTSFNETGVSVNKPPYIALLAAIADGECGAQPTLVCAYLGDLGDLPAGWQRADGTNGTPNVKGRVPIGSGGALSPGDTGGNASNQAVTGAASVPSATVNHNHGTSAGFSGSAIDHSAYDWTHGHASWSGTIAVMPPYKVLYFIAFTG